MLIASVWSVGHFSGIPALRLRGIYLAIATIAFVEVLRVMSLEITGGAVGIPNRSRHQSSICGLLYPCW